MINRNDIVGIIKKYNFDSKDYIIISGAAMVLYGIKEQTGDIDIAVSPKMFGQLLLNHNCEFEKTERGNPCYFIDKVINFSENYYNENRKYVEGLPLQTIDDLIKLKKGLHREKDIKDLQLIKDFQNKWYLQNYKI